MEIINYKSIGTVLYTVLRNPLASELTKDEASEYALEFIKLLGAPVAYVDKVTDPIEIVTHKAELPCDILYLQGIRKVELDSEYNITEGTALRSATDIYHTSPTDSPSENTYSITKGIIFISEPKGYIQISYKGIATDDEGYPMIPDNQKVQLGMEYYILSRYLEPIWLMGKITDKAFEYIQQKRYFYMPSAQTHLNMPSADKMETLMNTLNRLIISTSSHANGFKNLGEKEIIKKYN
jgi:hypothetical protein